MNEITKTSLLTIATIFGSIGGALMASVESRIVGAIFLGVAVLILLVRGILKAKGIDIEGVKK